jgi:hypothetical protein
MFFPALGGIAVAGLGERVPRLTPIPWAAAVLCFLSTMRPGDLSGGDVQYLVKEDWRSRAIDRERYGPGTTIACLYGTHDDSNGESYRMYGPAFSRRVVYLPSVRSVDDLMAQLTQHQAAWLFAQARNGDGSAHRVVLEAVRQGRLERRERSLYGVPRAK